MATTSRRATYPQTPFRFRVSRSTTLAFASVVAAILLWQVGASMYARPIFFPTPLAVLDAGVDLARDGTLMGHVGSSIGRILAGFLLGSVIGAPLGLLMGYMPVVNALLQPYVQFFRFIPAIAWLTPAVIWLGIGEEPKVAVIVYVTLFIVTLNAIVGVSNVSPNRLWAARSLGASPVDVFRRVVVPSSMPFILTGMRLAMGNAFATVVAAEMIAADTGIGYLIHSSRLWMATEVIFLGVVLLGVLGYLTDLLFRVLIKRWAGQYGPVE